MVEDSAGAVEAARSSARPPSSQYLIVSIETKLTTRGMKPDEIENRRTLSKQTVYVPSSMRSAGVPVHHEKDSHGKAEPVTHPGWRGGGRASHGERRWRGLRYNARRNDINSP
jgi:hypothetical protein